MHGWRKTRVRRVGRYKTIAVPKETSDPAGEPLVDLSTELRCALSLKAALHLRQVLGFKVVAESGVGLRSLISDDKYPLPFNPE